MNLITFPLKNTSFENHKLGLYIFGEKTKKLLAVRSYGVTFLFFYLKNILLNLAFLSGNGVNYYFYFI